ncbi:PAS domain-containing protein [Devosia neptuniae]|jgi:PAS domain S-box-containing protein|uniref:PAS domain-containing sensor histidine kinase n=1 Tax=Devosia TaxID=46913 RepID=UPI0022AFB8AC|nr:PAS domain-containing protein [Devosia neptuniae]MCZ4344933.1 PAS domain-containing protein [Devosia neptuniae]|tara:strand:- start:12066 stop:13973 length:1908 start_codon:yes stop_codon:yes gene_type:complete
MPKSLFPAASAETRAQLESDPTLKLVNEYDWTSNPLGPIPEWPESLKGAVRVMMAASAPMAMLIGHQGILIYNNAYAVFAGQRHPAIFGMPAVDAWPEAAEFNADKVMRCMRGETVTLKDQEMLLDRHGQFETTWLDLHYSPVLGEDGQPLAGICVVLDTTDQVLAKQALARSEERLSLALSGSGLVGTWDWDVPGDTVTADDRFAELFNLDPQQAGLGVPLKDFLAAIYPEDAERVGEEIATSIREKSPYHSEYRVQGRNGEIRWVVASGRPRFNAEGVIQRFPGVLVDITEQRRTTDALAESELRFRTLADAMPQMVWSTLPDGFHDYYNARWYEFTGVPDGSTDGEAWNGMFHPDDQDRAWGVWKNSLDTGEPYQIEYRLRHRSGEYRWTLGLALPIRDASGTIVRWIGTCTDIHEAKLAAEERELVAQELSHRIKNIFAVLTGIISLSARSRPELKPFANELRQRIYALGEAHDFVRPHSSESRPSVSQSSLKSLIERLMQPYRDIDEQRVTFEGDDTEIDDGAATPLALLFHELATNAAKYGALSIDTGRVVLTGQGPTDGRYHLSWKEVGGPEVTPGETSGFGSRVIELSVQGQLRGELQRAWDKDGLRVEVDLPIEALKRSAKLQRQS